jgi:hypothetical protein
VGRGAHPDDTRLATFGRAGQPGIVFLRFSVPLPPEADVLEAYVILERATSVDADAVPIALHTARVVSPWRARSLSWATQPRVEEVGAPVTRVSSAASSIVRLHVRDTVQRWRTRERDELGLAILSEGESVTGVTFALAPVDGALDRGDLILAPQSALMRQLVGPRLEVYVK